MHTLLRTLWVGLALTGCIPSAQVPTWTQDIQPFVGVKCQGCHHDRDNFARPYTEYDVVAAMAPLMLQAMDGNEMPPYLMPPFGLQQTDECVEPWSFRDDNRPTASEKATFAAWIAAGTPEGSLEDSTPFESPTPQELIGPGVETYTIAGTTLAQGEEEDQYLCFSIDPLANQERWLDGIAVNPDNNDIVHHVVVFLDPTGESTAKASATGSYDCFGGPGVSESSVVFAWAPGGLPMAFPKESGLSVPKDGRLVVQIHYHPTGEQAQDATQIAVRWRESTPAYPARSRVYGGVHERQTDSEHWVNPPFVIPANAAAHKETWVEALDVPETGDYRLWSLFPHMHVAGTDIKVSLIRSNGEEVCLGQIPQWDFEWQRSYVWEGEISELPRLLPGDSLRVRCTFDNSTTNPALMAYTDNAPPQAIGVGEDTFDEMCTAILGVVQVE